MKGKNVHDTENLRQQAEQALHALRQSTAGHSGPAHDLEAMFQDLQIHQIEMEMQNDELRVVNEELELQQLKFASIYNLAPVGYFILDEAGFIEEVNDAGYTGLLAGGKAGIVGKSLHRFITAERCDDFYRYFSLILQTGKRQSIQLKMVSGTGHEFDAQLEGIAVRASLNAPLQCYMAIVDISDSIRAKQHLSETTERLELALQTSGASIWELDTETMKFQSEELVKRRSGQQPGFTHTYNSFLELLHPDDREAVDQHFRTAINQQREIDTFCRIINQLENYNYYSLTGHAVAKNGNNNCFVGIMMDITERKKAEEETQRLKQDQQKNLTLAMLNGQENAGKRISDALHDGVSQLLYGIKMKLGTLPGDKTNNEILNSVYEMLNMAITETRNISFELAPSILTDFGLATTLDEMAKRLSCPTMRIKASFSGLHERLGLSLETGIFRMIQELINNCMKHSEASLVSIEIKKRAMINITVKDNGKGFVVSDQEINPEGSGLSSIRNRVNLYNGSVHIEAEPGAGTTVKIMLPFES